MKSFKCFPNTTIMQKLNIHELYQTTLIFTRCRTQPVKVIGWQKHQSCNFRHKTDPNKKSLGVLKHHLLRDTRSD